MDGSSPAGATASADLAGYGALAAELATLKRIRDASTPDSLASRLFRRAWASLCAGTPLAQVTHAVSADAIVALRLGGIDRAVLLQAGLSPGEASGILLASLSETLLAPLDEAAGAIPAGLAGGLRAHAGQEAGTGSVPPFVEALIRQPRAGATCPGKPRLMLEPPEGHGDHCLAVAVLGVLLSPQYGADPAPVFLAGLAHHLHNAALPDAGYAGEMLLGAHLTPILRRLTGQALQTLPPPLQADTRAALALAADDTTPEGRAFNAADVIDRITEVRHFAAVAGFTEAQALDDMQLVHAGPLQAFHHTALRRTGLVPA